MFQPITPIVLGEAVVVGFLLIIFVYVASAIVSLMGLKPSLPDICKTWNKNHIMEISVFLAGALFHLSFEVLGLNRQYVLSKK